MSQVNINLDPETLRPLVAEVVRQVLEQLDADRAKLDGPRLAYSEEEAARLLGLEPHCLRDERRRGRITASQIVGRRVRYIREDLVGYLQRRRIAID
jgi:hypothetical protein